MMVEFQHHNSRGLWEFQRSHGQGSGVSSKPLALLSEGLYTTPNSMLPHPSLPSPFCSTVHGAQGSHVLGKYCPAMLHPHPFPVLRVLGMELMALHMWGRHLTTELHLTASFNFLFWQSLTKLTKLALKLISSCLSLMSSWNYRFYTIGPCQCIGILALRYLFVQVVALRGASLLVEPVSRKTGLRISLIPSTEIMVLERSSCLWWRELHLTLNLLHLSLIFLRYYE